MKGLFILGAIIVAAWGLVAMIVATWAGIIGAVCVWRHVRFKVACARAARHPVNGPGRNDGIGSVTTRDQMILAGIEEATADPIAWLLSDGRDR